MLAFLLVRGYGDDGAFVCIATGLGFCAGNEAARRSESAATMSMNRSRIIFVGLVSSFGTWMLDRCQYNSRDVAREISRCSLIQLDCLVANLLALLQCLDVPLLRDLPHDHDSLVFPHSIEIAGETKLLGGLAAVVDEAIVEIF